MLPDQFYRLTPSSLRGIPRQAPRATWTGFHQPQAQQRRLLCRSLPNRGLRLDGKCSSSHHGEDSASAVASRAQKDLHFGSRSFRAPPVCSNKYMCSVGRVFPRKANCSPKQNVTYIHFRFAGSQAEFIRMFRDHLLRLL